jgi:hypothetical protein
MIEANPTELTAGPKQCARCGATFICKVDDLPHCQCVNVSLPLAALEALKDRYSDCLCSRCLKEIAGMERAGDEPLDAGSARRPR